MVQQTGRYESGAPGPRIPQYVATAIMGLVVTTAVGAFGLARSLDGAVMEHNARLRAVESRVADLCEALQCRTSSAHPICTRLRLIEKAFINEHPDKNGSLFD